jgi:hypothetical protein
MTTMSTGFWAFTTRMMFRPVLGHTGTRPGDLEAVIFPSTDGSRLEGMLAPAVGRPRGVVLLCHPFTRHGFEFFFKGPVLQSLRDAGLQVVLFNFKGFGRSEFRGANFGDDVVGAFEYAHARYPDLPVYVYGLSFGGFHAVGALTRLDGRVTAALLDSVPLRPSDFFRSGVTGPVMRWLGTSRWAVPTGTDPIDGKLGTIGKTRLCIVCGANDKYADLGALQAAVKGRSLLELVTLPGLGHLDAFKQHSQHYLELVASKLGPAIVVQAQTDTDAVTGA